jgi:16S rRNA (guanine527-N7)-methyltransferase
MMPNVREQLERIGDELGWPLGSVELDRLSKLRALWLGQGRAINLTGASTDAELLAHLGDGIAAVACAARLAELGPTLHWLDVGSGGGFPALIVAAITPVTLVLVEPRQRRAAFLEFALASVGNKSRVIRARLDDDTWRRYCVEQQIKPGSRRFSIASSRAVFAPDRWLELGDNLVMERGVVIAHLRPGQLEVGGRAPEAVVEWGTSRIAGFRAR